MKIVPRDGTSLKMVITGMIVSKEVLGRVAEVWTPKLFGQPWADLVANWCVSWYVRYKSAPQQQIKQLFHIWAEDDADETTEKAVAAFLGGLSDEYDAAGFNAGHVIDLAGEVINRNRLTTMRNRLDAALAVNDLERAELAVQSPRVEVGANAAVDVFASQYLIKEAVMSRVNMVPVIKLPGAIGSFTDILFERESLVAFEGPEKRGKCLYGGTLITMADGSLKTIKEIAEGGGGRVLSLDLEDMMFRKDAVVSQRHLSGRKRCYKLVTKSGREITATADHKFLTPTGWRRLGDLKVGNFVAAPKGSGVFGDGESSVAKVKFLAYMTADGCSMNWTYSKTNPNLIADFHAACDSLRLDWTRSDTRKVTAVLASGGRRTQLMEECGLSGKLSKEKQVPEWLMKCRRYLVREYLKVLFSSDGSLYRDKRGAAQVELTMASETLVRQVSHLLNRFGIVHRFGYKETKCGGKVFDSWRILIRSQEYVLKFIAEIGSVADMWGTKVDHAVVSSKSFMDRIPHEVVREEWERVKEGGRGALSRAFGTKSHTVREQLRKGLSMMRQQFVDIPDELVRRRLLDSEVLWDEVDEIEFAGVKDTYDLGVAGTHNFVANDLVTHNSWWLQEMGWQAVLQGKRTAFFSCGDLSLIQQARRLVTRAAGRPITATKEGQRIKIPTFLEVVDGSLPKVTYDYKEYPEPLDWKDAWKQFVAISKMNLGGQRDLLKLSTHGTNTLTVMGLQSTLDRWANDGWRPDVIIIDYADILGPPVGLVANSKEAIDHNWAALRSMSIVDHTLIITATQANAAAYSVEMIGKQHFSGSKGKNAQVTAMIGINQTPGEKDLGVYRLNLPAARDSELNDQTCVVTAGCLSVANPCILSSF